MQKIKMAIATLALTLVTVMSPNQSQAGVQVTAVLAGPAMWASCLAVSYGNIFFCGPTTLINIMAASTNGTMAGGTMGNPAAVGTMMNPYLIGLDVEQPNDGFVLDAGKKLETEVAMGILTAREARVIKSELATKFDPSAPRSLDASALTDLRDRRIALIKFAHANNLSELTAAYLAQSVFGLNL